MFPGSRLSLSLSRGPLWFDHLFQWEIIRAAAASSVYRCVMRSSARRNLLVLHTRGREVMRQCGPSPDPRRDAAAAAAATTTSSLAHARMDRWDPLESKKERKKLPSPSPSLLWRPSIENSSQERVGAGTELGCALGQLRHGRALRDVTRIDANKNAEWGHLFDNAESFGGRGRRGRSWRARKAVRHRNQRRPIPGGVRWIKPQGVSAATAARGIPTEGPSRWSRPTQRYPGSASSPPSAQQRLHPAQLFLEAARSVAWQSWNWAELHGYGRLGFDPFS